MPLEPAPITLLLTQTPLGFTMVSHPILEDDSEPEEGEDFCEEDDKSSTLSIPNDFDMVYALHSFAATVKRMSSKETLYSSWTTAIYWCPFVFSKLRKSGTSQLKVCIETPSERLPRSNKHRNIVVRFFITYLLRLLNNQIFVHSLQ